MQIKYFHSYMKITTYSLPDSIEPWPRDYQLYILFNHLLFQTIEVQKVKFRIVSIGLSHNFTCVRSVDCCCLSTSLCVIGRVRSSRHTSTVCAASSRYYTACTASVVDAVAFRFYEQPMYPFHSQDSCFLYEFKSGRN